MIKSIKILLAYTNNPRIMKFIDATQFNKEGNMIQTLQVAVLFISTIAVSAMIIIDVLEDRKGELK